MFQVIPAGALWTLPSDNNLYAPFDTHKVGPKYDFNFAGMHGVSVPVAPVPPHPLAYPVLPSARATDYTRCAVSDPGIAPCNAGAGYRCMPDEIAAIVPIA